MGIFNLLGKRKTETLSKTKDLDESAVYSGMRVEVTTGEGEMLFVAKLMGLHGNKGELHQYSEFETDQKTEPVRVNIRGYSDYEKKAVYMEGVITPGENHICQVEDLTIVKIGNARAFFRLETDIDATVTMFTGLERGEKPCRLLNVSVGGAYIRSAGEYCEGDKFLLKFKLLEDRPASAMYCQVMRVIEKEGGETEYGCQFLEMTDDVERTITQSIFAVQRKQREKL